MKLNDTELDAMLSAEENPRTEQDFVFKNAGPQAKKPLIVRLLPYASVAAALVLCAAVLLPTLNRETVPGEIEPGDLVVHVDSDTPENPKNPYEEQSNPTIPDDPEIPEDPIDEPKPEDPPVIKPENPELPTWYQPGQFTLVSVLRNADSPVLTAASPANEGLFQFCANTNVQGNMLNKFEYIVNARFVAGDNTFTTTSEHRGHKGLFYDVEAGKPVCYSCLVKEILGDDTLDVGVEPITNERYVSCYLYDKRVTRRFLVDLETKKVVEMPVLSYNDIETFTVSYDGRFAVTHAEQTDSPYEAVYLIDTASGTYKQINQGQPCFFQSTFSPDSQNVLTLLSNDGETNYLTSERCIFRLYNVSNGAECTCYGKVVSFEGDLLVTKKGSTYHVYDRTTCTETEIPDNLYAIVDVQNTLLRVHCKTGDAEEIVSNPSAYLVSDNGLYLYTYRTLENEIYCYNVKTGDYFTVSVDNEFTDYIRSISEDYNVYYQMSLSKSMDQLLITYYSNKKPTAPVIPEMTEEQKLREEKAERRSKSIEVMREALKKKNNIIDYLDYIIANGYKEEYDLHAYTGDGYIVVYVGVQNYMAVVDDYRNHTFKIYADTPTSDHAFVSLYKPAPNTTKEATCKNTYDETLKKIKALGIPVSTGAFDYSIFNTNDKFDAAKARDYKFSKSFVAAHGRDVDLFKRVCEAKKRVYGISGDRTAVGNFAIGSARFVLVTNGSNYYMRDSYDEEIYEIPKAIFDELLAAPWCRHIAPDDHWIIWD